jgi:hypothetical protein
MRGRLRTLARVARAQVLLVVNGKAVGSGSEGPVATGAGVPAATSGG